MFGWVGKHDVARKAALALLQSSAAAGNVYTMDTFAEIMNAAMNRDGDNGENKFTGDMLTRAFSAKGNKKYVHNTN